MLQRFFKRLGREQRGITIVELAVTLPVAAIIVVALVSILFSQYVAVLAESNRSNLRSQGQALLTSLQDELLFTIEYGHTLSDDLADPYEPSGGWDYDTDPQTLIIHEIALDGTRADTNRNIIRKRENPCATSLVTSNSVALNNIIYFTEDNPDSDYLKLYKRTIVPEYDVCSIDRSSGDPCVPVTSTCLGVAKGTTCPEANVGTGPCIKQDSLLSENVVDFEIHYFANNNVETSFPSASEKVELTLVLGDRIYGKSVETTINHTIRKIN